MNQCRQNELKIITVDGPQRDILKRKTENIRSNELPLAQEIAEQLILALKPHFPAAGLAAPQIGISKSVFIYSYDRDPKNLEIVINPTFEPIGNHKIEGWEGCFSILLSEEVWLLAQVPRYESIKAIYTGQNGERIEKYLEGFAAKVFQHEYDHLQGMTNIERSDATIRKFNSKKELLSFLQTVKNEDAVKYKKPT
jgi:peptide deformylase